MEPAMIIKNARYVITQNKSREILENVDILIEDGKITEIGNKLEKTDEVYDASDKIVLPGLINSHTHLPMSLFRGVSDKKNLHEWLEEDISRLEAKLNDNIVYYGTMLSILEGIATGTTTFCDMYSYTNAILKAVEKSGIRAFLGSGLKDRNDTSKIMEEIKRVKGIVRMIKKSNGNAKPILGLHWTLTCSDEIIVKLAEMNTEKFPIHMHVSETEMEVRKNIERYGKRPFERLDGLGILNENFAAAHAVHIDDHEIETIIERGSKIIYNPIANMKLADGICPVIKLMKGGVCIALGTDSPASNDNLNMFEEMKFGSLIQKVSNNDAAVMCAQETLDMATINAAKVLGSGLNIGSIENSKFADMIFINKNDVTMNPMSSRKNIITNLIYSFNGNVSDVMVNGRFLLKDFSYTTINKNDIINKVNKIVVDNF